jgi:hypothetical protein
MLRVLIAAAGLMAAGLLVQADEPAPAGPAKVEAARLRYQPKGPKVTRTIKRKRVTEDAPSQLDLSLAVTVPGKKLIGIDRKASPLTKFADDRGTDLSGGKPISLGMVPQINPDGSLLLATLFSRTRLAADARRVIVEGEITAVCGSVPATATLKDLDVKVAGGFRLGDEMKARGKIADFPVRVTRAGLARTPQVMIDAPDQRITRVVRIDADGGAIQLKRVARSNTADGGVSQHYALDKSVEKATIQITYYTKVERVKIPVALKIGPGL